MKKCRVFRVTRRRSFASERAAQAGFGLVEMMIAMVLGLIVISGVTSIFLANQQSYRTNAGLSDVQEGSRIAFEMLARDIRVAGLTGCDSTSGRVSNVLNGGSTNWYADWGNALHGYDDATQDPALTGITGNGAPVAGTSSVHVISAGALAATIQTDKEPAANFKLNETTTDLQSGDIIMVCDYDHTTIVQISNYNNNNVTVVHNTGNTVSPGNCSKGLGYPTDCSSTNGNIYSFPPNSQIAELSASDWYIGTNPVGGRSLYRLTLVNSGGNGVTQVAQEMVRNVTNMVISYNQQGTAGFSNAATISSSGTGWATVDAAQVQLTVQSTFQRAGTDAKPITRTFVATDTVRNRVP